MDSLGVRKCRFFPFSSTLLYLLNFKQSKPQSKTFSSVSIVSPTVGLASFAQSLWQKAFNECPFSPIFGVKSIHHGEDMLILKGIRSSLPENEDESWPRMKNKSPQTPASTSQPRIALLCIPASIPSISRHVGK